MKSTIEIVRLVRRLKRFKVSEADPYVHPRICDEAADVIMDFLLLDEREENEIKKTDVSNLS